MSEPPTILPDSRVKVLRIIARMNVGGPAVQISSLMRGLDPNEFDHKLITGYCEDDEADYLEINAKDISVERIKGLGRSINLLSDVLCVLRIIKKIREFKPDIVHTHTAKAGVIGRIASVLSGHKSKRIHTFHGHILHGYFSPLKTNVYIFIEKILSIFTHKFLCVGSKVRDDLIKAGIGNPDKYLVFPPGVEKPMIFERQTAANRLGISADGVYCLYLGRVTRIKRPDRLLEVATILKSKNVEVKFLIAGDGDLFQNIRDSAAALDLPFIFLGWQHDLAALFSVANILVMTSDNEGTPLSIVQAQLSGVPVVSTNVGSISEVLLDGVSGFLTNLDAKLIAEKIEFLINNPKQRVEMGAAGLSFAGEKFSPRRLVSDHERLYKELIPSPASF
jgi:glycosyltransferase involved in cell wall biosynthesis